MAENIHFYCKIAICNFVIMFFFSSFANSVEVSEIESPYRATLYKKYGYDIDTDEAVNKSIELENIRKVYIENKNNIYADRKKTEIQIEKQKEETELERKKIEQVSEKKQTNDASTNETILVKKKQKQKSWIEEWLPEYETKPMDLVGEYVNVKVWLAWPYTTGINAKETKGYTDNYKTLQLFTGKAKYYLMPAIFVSAGNDRLKRLRWEIELGYLPLIARNTGNLVSDPALQGYTFSINAKDLSVHLLTLSVNGFFQHEFLDRKLVGFIGLGVGVGYAWSMGTTLSSDFVMPVVSGHIGISFVVGKKSKINIAYSMMYSRMTLPNKYSFDRVNQYGASGSNMAIQSGSLKFDALLINAFSIEYMFYK